MTGGAFPRAGRPYAQRGGRGVIFLDRAELTVLERSEHIAEWVRLTTDSHAAQLAPHRKAGQQPGGINAATRELGIERTEAQRAATTRTTANTSAPIRRRNPCHADTWRAARRVRTTFGRSYLSEHGAGETPAYQSLQEGPKVAGGPILQPEGDRHALVLPVLPLDHPRRREQLDHPRAGSMGPGGPPSLLTLPTTCRCSVITQP